MNNGIIFGLVFVVVGLFGIFRMVSVRQREKRDNPMMKQERAWTDPGYIFSYGILVVGLVILSLGLIIPFAFK